jgi:hypothetical protein
MRTPIARSVIALSSSIITAGLLWLIAATTANSQPIVYAAPDGGVVGNGTPASCTQAAFDAKLSGGGTIDFNCGGSPVTIVLTSTKTITANTTIDGGGKITLSGGDTTKLFWVNAGVRLTLNNITIAHGYSGLGGCVLVVGTLNATQTTFTDCASRGFFGNGGAIFSNGTLALTNTLVLKNQVDRNGGGIYLLGGQATLNHVGVLSNTAWVTYTGSGGGVYVDANTNFVASDSNFSYNGIGWQGHGGGLAVYTSTALLVNASANYNHGLNAALGGGFYAENSQFTLQGGSANGNYGLGSAGGLYLETTVANISNARINDNIVSSSGGGFYTYKGSLQMNNTQVNGNSGGSDGGGFYLYNTPATIANSTINNNQGGRNGGAIENYMNTLTLDHVTVSGNVNTGEALVGNQGDGGGIFNDRATLIATNSTIDHNTSTGTGGGLYNASDSTLNLTNVTVSGNHAAIEGGGLYNETNFSVSDWTYITMTNVTVKDNQAAHGGGLWNGTDAHNLVYLKNTVMADSTGGNCYGKAIASAKYSWSTDTTCTLSGTGNHSNTPAGLFPLGNYGGPTKTHLPSPASPLVNGITGVDFPSTDQRGQPRPSNGALADIGAVERQSSGDPLIAPWLYLPLIKR